MTISGRWSRHWSSFCPGRVALSAPGFIATFVWLIRFRDTVPRQLRVIPLRVVFALAPVSPHVGNWRWVLLSPLEWEIGGRTV